MGHADAAERTRGRQIGVNGVGRQTSVGNIVGTARHITTGFGVDRPVERVSADFIKDLDFTRNDSAVPFHAGFDFHHRAVASTGEKDLVTCQNPLHGTARLAREQGKSGLEPRVRLAAVAAAQRRHDHAHLIFRQFENLRQLLLHAGGILRSGMHHQFAARLPIGSGGMGLDMAVLHRRQCISIVEDLVRFLKTFLDVSVFDSEHAANVAAQLEIEFLAVHARLGLIALRVQHGRVGLGGFEKIEHRR